MSRCEPESLLQCKLTKWIWSTVPIGLFVVGTVGNVINIVVLSRRRMRASSTSVYLTCMAFGDLLFLWIGMGPRMMLQAYEIDLKAKSEFLCKMITWVPVTAGGCSVWSLVMMTMERFLLTKWPVTARARLTRKKAIIACVTVVLAVLSLTLQVLIVATLKSSTEYDENENKLLVNTACVYIYGQSATYYKTGWPVLVLVAFNLAPIVLILLGNVSIVLTLISQRRKLRRTNPELTHQHIVSPNKGKAATKMLFLVSAMFIVTMSPFTLGNAIMSQLKVTSITEKATRQLIYSVLRNIMYFNFTFNFVLYFVSGPLFKQEWKSLVKGVRAKVLHLYGRQNVGNETQTASTNSTRNSNIPDTNNTPQRTA